MKIRNLVVGLILGIALTLVTAVLSNTVRFVGACGAPGADPCPTYGVSPAPGTGSK